MTAACIAEKRCKRAASQGAVNGERIRTTKGHWKNRQKKFENRELKLEFWGACPYAHARPDLGVVDFGF
jgi:hypothetical protein